MANCIKCGNSSFKYEELTPSGSKFPQGFIVCSQCGAVAGLVSPHNLPTAISNVGNMVSALEDRLLRIERLLLSLGQADK